MHLPRLNKRRVRPDHDAVRLQAPPSDVCAVRVKLGAILLPRLTLMVIGLLGITFYLLPAAMCSSARGFIHRSQRRIRHGRGLRPACVLVRLIVVAVDTMEEKGAVTPAPVQQREDLGSISTARPWRARAAACPPSPAASVSRRRGEPATAMQAPPRQREPAAGAENHDLESGADPERGAWESAGPLLPYITGGGVHIVK